MLSRNLIVGSRSSLASPARIALLAAMLIFAISTLYMALVGGQVDWRTYEFAVDRWLAGQPIYAAAQLSGPYRLQDVLLTGYAYPPPSVVMMVPFAAGTSGLIAWLCLNVSVFVGGMAILTQRYAGPAVTAALALLFAILAVFGPYAETVATGNNSLLFAGVFALVLAIPGSWSGPAAALAAINRVTPGFLLALAWRSGHRRREIVSATLVGGASVVLTLPILGLQSWRDYLTSLTGVVPACDQTVNSLTCMLLPVVGGEPAKLLSIAAALICVGLALAVKRRLLAGALIAVAIVLPLPDLWPHYLLFPFVALWACLAAAFGSVRIQRSAQRTPAAVAVKS